MWGGGGGVGVGWEGDWGGESGGGAGLVEVGRGKRNACWGADDDDNDVELNVHRRRADIIRDQQ